MPQVFSLPFKGRAAHFLAGVTVLQIIPGLEASPAAREAIEIAASLAAAGARALVACAGGRMKGELQAKGGVFVPFPSRTKNPLAMALNVRRLAQLIAAENADIVHARSRALAWVAYGATRLTKTPFVTTFPSIYQGSTIARRYNSVLARGDAVLVDSNFTADLIAELHSPAAGKIRVVHHGLDCQVFTPDAVAPARVQTTRRHWKVAPHERIVLLAAPTRPGSGHKILIEAAGLLSRSGLAGVKFILACDRRENSALDRGIDHAIATEGLQGIMYRTSHCDLPAALLAASIVVVPATEARAFGDAAVQAQAMGTPVVAANVGAAPEIVLAPSVVEESSRTGFLVPPGNAAALALAIASVLGLGAAASGRLSSRARKHVEACFSAEHMCAATLETYMDLRRRGTR